MRRGNGEESGDSWLNSHRSECGAGLALRRNRTPGSLATHLARARVCVCRSADRVSVVNVSHPDYSQSVLTPSFIQSSSLHLHEAVSWSQHSLRLSAAFRSVMISKVWSSWIGIHHINFCSLSRLNECVNLYQCGHRGIILIIIIDVTKQFKWSDCCHFCDGS